MTVSDGDKGLSTSAPHASRKVLVYGASGAIGRAVVSGFAGEGASVIGVSRNAAEVPGAAEVVSGLDIEAVTANICARFGAFDAVVWAQGANLSDSVDAFDPRAHLEVYEANCLYVLRSLSQLSQRQGLAAGGARLCVVSSIWQERARQDKLSYCVSKAALGGLVRACAADLGRAGHMINAVLPGALDTPMTRANLSPSQLGRLSEATSLARLADLDSLVGMIRHLCSPMNNSVTGQSIPVDLGFSNVRLV